MSLCFMNHLMKLRINNQINEGDNDEIDKDVLI